MVGTIACAASIKAPAAHFVLETGIRFVRIL